MKKRIGIGLLVASFFWLLIDAASTFTSYQHTLWIWHSQNLPKGDTIPRDAAISAMRDLSLALKDRHRIVLIPGLFMLTGGLLMFFARTANGRITEAEQDVHGNTH
jgi:hypothetical protein